MTKIFTALGCSKRDAESAVGSDALVDASPQGREWILAREVAEFRRLLTRERQPLEVFAPADFASAKRREVFGQELDVDQRDSQLFEHLDAGKQRELRGVGPAVEHALR